MSAHIINGKELAATLRSNISQRVASLKDSGMVPGLAVVLVGDDPASASYVRAKDRACETAGIASFQHRLPAETSEADLLSLVETLNNDPKVHGILVQLPLPDHMDDEKVIDAIAPEKDVDGFHAMSLGKMLQGRDTFVSCTPAGVVEMLKAAKITTRGKHVVIVGRSNIVGRPLANLLSLKGPYGDATVTLCHSRTPDLPAMCRQADILIAAIGRPNFITADMVKEGAVVIDVGINRVEDTSAKRGYRLVGDVEYGPVSEKASHITPVPGGVGPMTIAMLLSNTLTSAERHHG